MTTPLTAEDIKHRIWTRIEKEVPNAHRPGNEFSAIGSAFLELYEIIAAQANEIEALKASRVTMRPAAPAAPVVLPATAALDAARADRDTTPGHYWR
jgi:hypothetical protein